MLNDILTFLRQDGVNTNDSAQKANAIIKINQACRRLYQKYELVGSTDEELLQVHVSSHQVALPRHIGEVRMLRAGYMQHPIDLWEAYQRYHESGDTRVSHLNYRTRPARPLERSLDNASQLSFLLPLADTAANSFVVIGKGENSNNIVESVSIPAGTLEVSTVNSFEEIREILRVSGTTYDVTVADVEDNILAVIPNNAKESKYNVIQVLESTYTSATGVGYYPVECIYQKALFELKDDNDSFVCGDAYDEAIYWEVKLFDAAKQKDDMAYKAAETMRDSIVAAISHNRIKGKSRKIDIAEPSAFKISRYIKRSYCHD